MLGEDPLLELRFVLFVLISILFAIQIPKQSILGFQLKGWEIHDSRQCNRNYLKHGGSSTVSSNATPLLFASTLICNRTGVFIQIVQVSERERVLTVAAGGELIGIGGGWCCSECCGGIAVDVALSLVILITFFFFFFLYFFRKFEKP